MALSFYAVNVHAAPATKTPTVIPTITATPTATITPTEGIVIIAFVATQTPPLDIYGVFETMTFNKLETGETVYLFKMSNRKIDILKAYINLKSIMLTETQLTTLKTNSAILRKSYEAIK